MTQPMNLHEALTLQEARDTLGVSLMTVWRWVHDGRLERAVPPRGLPEAGRPHEHWVTRASVLKLQQERERWRKQ